MITISITEGLGNQLFQYFFAESLRIKLGKAGDINYLYDFKENNQKKLWEIFNVDIQWLDIKETNNYHYLCNFSPSSRNILAKIVKVLKLNKHINLLEDESRLDLVNLSKNKNYLFRGYWQNYKFFEDNFEIIKKKLIFKNKIILRDLLSDHGLLKNNPNVVGVHIRGGDYLLKKNKKLKNNIDGKYYFDSIELFLKVYKNCLFIFFTDDLTYLEKIISFKNNNFIKISDISKERINDFQLLSQCDNYIIPNSTYSLWAYYLNKNNNKFIYTPSKWFVFNKNKIDNFIII